MKLSKATNFQLEDIDGKIFDLYKYQGNAWLLFFFFRGEWCQHCRKQLAELKANFQWFKKRKIKIVALSSDDHLFTSILRAVLKPKFSILSDARWRIFKLYGFKRPNDEKNIKPALFLVNPKHQIRYHYIGKTKEDRPSITQLKKICQKYI